MAKGASVESHRGDNDATDTPRRGGMTGNTVAIVVLMWIVLTQWCSLSQLRAEVQSLQLEVRGAGRAERLSPLPLAPLDGDSAPCSCDANTAQIASLGNRVNLLAAEVTEAHANATAAAATVKANGARLDALNASSSQLSDDIVRDENQLAMALSALSGFQHTLEGLETNVSACCHVGGAGAA
eukprot:m.460688 g.460688  ORF g.460688 m.460688 type:complete len:183 (-) comp22100_c0_seq1:138-686(-)